MSWYTGFEHIVRESEPLAPYTWLRLGGPAEFFAEPTTSDELAGLVKVCREAELPVRLLGSGSNLLISDAGVPGLVMMLSAPAFAQIAVEGQAIVAGGGARLAHVISTAVREGLAGLEMLVGIPGTVGGALHGNAGGHTGDIGQWTAEATVMTRGGEIITRRRPELQFAYRQSSLDELVILSARFELEPEDRIELTRRMQKLWIVKKASQPTADSAMGRIFKDPGGMSAAELIDHAGLKAARVGEAEVSDRDANFIIARPGTKADDVRRLIDLIRSRVHEQLSVELETQIEMW